MSRDVLSKRDRALVDYRFRIVEPQNYPGLTPRLEPGAKPVRILHDYDETPPGGLRAGHKLHIRCAFGHLHWHGYVVEIDDGRVALIGQQCAREHFGADVIEAIEKTYHSAKDRQFEIKRLQEIRRLLPAAMTELRSFAKAPSVVVFDAFWDKLRRLYGNAARELAASVRTSEGKLISYREIRDTNQEVAQAKKKRPDLYSATESEPPSRRPFAVARWKQFLESEPHVYKKVPAEMGACDGWRLFDGKRRPVLARLVDEMIMLAENADAGEPIELISAAGFAKIRNQLDKLFQKIDEMRYALGEQRALTSEANVDRILKWASQSKLQLRMQYLIGRSLTGFPLTPALVALHDLVRGENQETDLAA